MATSTFENYFPGKQKNAKKRRNVEHKRNKNNGASSRAKPVTTATWLQAAMLLKKLFFRMLLVAFFILVAAFVYEKRIVINNFVNRPVTSIAVGGEMTNIDQVKLQMLLTNLVDQRFFEMDIESLALNIEQIPWVNDVQIRKQWPDQIKVMVSERAPVARWGAAGLVDSNGEVFSSDGARIEFSSLPILNGSELTDSALVEKFLELEPMFAAKNIAIEQLSHSNTGSWSIKVAGGHDVVLGKHEFEKRLERFFTLWKATTLEQRATVLTMDFRYSNGAAVSRRSNKKHDGENR
ncbi:MAG: cell division protein FtsQ/DivIB [Pseudomonadales bacterium]|nr:cell division protein FtsQ/DivIB [Pseudomonadales bacterium]